MPLVGYVDFISAQTVTDMSFNIKWPSTGLLTIQMP